MITIYPNKGFAKATNFNLSLSNDVLSLYDSFLWDFGDGNTSRYISPNYKYKYPGNFTITVKAYNKKTGNNTVFTSNLNVGLYLSESIYFDVIPPPTFSGYYNKYPFKVNITSSQEGKHIIDLSTQFSKSYEKQNPENKWSFLRPEWKFLDLNGNKIDFIETKDTPIKIDDFGNLDTNGTTVGITGTAEFYLVDDNFNTEIGRAHV